MCIRDRIRRVWVLPSETMQKCCRCHDIRKTTGQNHPSSSRHGRSAHSGSGSCSFCLQKWLYACTVSYTHLDVYKRQLLGLLLSALLILATLLHQGIMMPFSSKPYLAPLMVFCLRRSPLLLTFFEWLSKKIHILS